MAPTVVRSFAKINLGLRIGPPRPDGFHALHTLFQTVELHDQITVHAEPADRTEITLRASDPRLPTDSRNTVYRMIAATVAQLGIDAKVSVHLQKNLPVQGGLGAGSANAAAALLGLERQLGMALPPADRLRMAEHVGSDVPLFLVGGTVYGHNRGEIVLPYPDLPSMACVIAAPAEGSSTPLAFRRWDDRITQLTPEAAQGRLDELSRVYASAFAPAGAGSGWPSQPGVLTGASGVFAARDPKGSVDEDLAGNPLLALVRTGMENDFEEIVFEQHPRFRDIKRALLGTESERPTPAEQQAVYAALSGSGSSLFGLYRSAEDADAARERVVLLGCRALVTRTLTRAEYWKGLFAD